MELWCKWSACQKSLFTAYSNCRKSIIKYFWFSLHQETHCLITSSAWNSSSAVCVVDWERRELKAWPAQNSSVTDSALTWSVWLRNKNKIKKTLTIWELKSQDFKTIYSLTFPHLWIFFFLLLEAARRSMTAEWKASFGLKYAFKFGKLQNILIVQFI